MTRFHQTSGSMRCLGAALSVVAAGVIGGCSQSAWSPTRSAMTRAEANDLMQRPASQHALGQPSRSLVLADDQYSRMSEPTSFSNASNVTATASVPTE